MKNKYAKRSRISEGKVRELVRYFAADLTALQAATLSGLNRNTVNRFYRGLRERILVACEAQRPLFGIVEVDESFFGARRVKGRRGRGAYGKTVVFGIFERQGQVYTEIVPDCSRPTLQGIIRGRVDPSTVINSDGWGGYNGLVDLGYGHFRVEHSVPIRLSPTSTICRVRRGCLGRRATRGWTYWNARLSRFRDRFRSSSDFSRTTRPAPPIWRGRGGVTGSSAPIAGRRQSPAASPTGPVSCGAGSAVATPV